MMREHARDQRQASPEGSTSSTLTYPWARWLFCQKLFRWTASKLAGRQLAAQTCEKGVEKGIRQVGSHNRLILFGFPPDSSGG